MIPICTKQREIAMSEENGSAPAGNPVEQTGQSGQWFDTFQSPEVKGWVESKGWKSPEAAAQSAWNLERYMGADKAGRGVVWPKDETDVEGWNNVYAKMGRPDSPEGYGLTVPEGADDSFVKAITPIMHKYGVSKAQAAGLSEAYSQFAAQQSEVMEAEWVEKSNAQFASLQKEWGQDFEKNAEMARRALNYAGLTKEQGEALEKALGVDVANKMLSFYGSNFVEHASPGNFNSGGASASGARARIKELINDKEFGKRLENGDAASQSEWNKLHTIASGG
jgi:hypothetical protein